VLTLIEQAEKAFEADEAEEMAAKLASGKSFTLEDFLKQLTMIRKMGPISGLLGMLPGMGQLKGQMKEAMENVDDSDLDRIAAIIRSMTPQERTEPKVLNGSRRLRIARGSGTTVNEVNRLVDQFFEAQKMMSQMLGGGGGMPGMPALPGMGGPRRSATKNTNKKRKKKTGPRR
jgi:signal recognition particle subunit SRP54